ncbi:alpha/beta hydrolase [Tepidiphilus margaritifer]|uniref:alpha/beta hydrolase n=1 Tax=Tepidiphilus margaritifer TaxID=203471 RepID=UPI0004299C3D|nr:alpha/beta fold hydrolase [Tepidiphilus margaritifer]
MTRIRIETLLVPGPAGTIEVLADLPAAPRGVALVCHPHPLFGGANTNKVTYTLARAYAELGYAALRPNFRGVGQSAGRHDHGEGETEDMLALLAWARGRWGEGELALAGFSFGAYVQTRVVGRLPDPPRHLTLVGLPHGLALGSGKQYDTPTLPEALPALLIHGEHDDIAPLARVLDWARPQTRPVVVIPGADHFFHGKLALIKMLVQRDHAAGR